MPSRFRFTKEKISGLPLPAEGARSTFYDRDVPKLAVRITSAGTRTFYVIKRAGRAMAWVKLGTFPDMTVEGARKAAERALGQFASGINPAEAKRLERNKQTLGAAFDRWKEDYAIPHGVKGVDHITTAIWQRFLGPLPDEPAKKHGRKRTKHAAGVDWSKRKLDAIHDEDVADLHIAIGKTNKTSANRVLELISAVYNRTGHGDINPARGIEVFKETKRARFLNQHDSKELERFFSALATDTSEDFKHFVLLSLLTGVRRTNVLAMRWQDVNTHTGTWTIPDTKSKNDEAQVVALVPEAVQILKTRKPKSAGFVFPAASKTGHLTPPKKRWSALLARANVSDLRIHDLRRSLGSWQAISGASLVVIGKTLGHKSPDATAIYARLHLDPVRASVETATSAMLTAGGIKKSADVVPIRTRKQKSRPTRRHRVKRGHGRYKAARTR